MYGAWAFDSERVSDQGEGVSWQQQRQGQAVCMIQNGVLTEGMQSGCVGLCVFRVEFHESRDVCQSAAAAHAGSAWRFCALNEEAVL